MDRGRLLQRLEEIGVDAVASQPVPHDRLVEIFDEHGGPLIARTDIVGARLPIRLNHRADAERAAMVLAGPTGQLWVEEPVPQRRSLAVTVIGDAHGDAAAMIECDTSALNLGICESPSPALLGAPDGEAIRGAFFDVATRIWRDLAVVGVGTIHFGLNIGGHFYVEDIGLGITPAQQLSEWVSGVDLVEWQLRVHAGQPISEDLHTPPESGHAFVAHVRRAPVSASEEEGAAVNFEEIGWPPTPAGTIRVFSPYETGMEVPGEDEALLARVTTFGAVRHQALLTLDRILAGCRFPPVQTNISELRRITNNESLRFGQYDVDTTF
jgi:acetyl/propionyl-CoA carboxylase alpha subunit